MPELPELFTYPFCYTPHPLVVEASRRLLARIDADPGLRGLFAEGKMLGVLLARRADGGVEELYAFSGLAGGKSCVEGFVPPIFDLTDPNGYFKREEASVSELSARIKELETAKEAARANVGDAADEAARLNSGDVTGEIARLKALRREKSVALQEWIFDQFVVLNARGERKSVREVFAARGLVPPGGTGECAAPRLLQHAYLHSLKPIAMGEFWYGASPAREIRQHGSFYPSCTGKCGPLLGFMLQGLNVEPNPLESDDCCADESLAYKVVYEDNAIIVVDKPSGMLAVPGRTLKVSLQERLSQRLGAPVLACHRLDMDTSGLIVFAKDIQAQASVQQQFEHRTVSKSYIARLVPGPALPRSGRIELPLSLDYYDRPRQMVDYEAGKQAVTDWELLRTLPGGECEVRFTPLTGRTHQLRVHAAHPSGLGRPILGDRLYGGGSHLDVRLDGFHCGSYGRLHLHAATLSFSHPLTGELLSFSSDLPW